MKDPLTRPKQRALRAGIATLCLFASGAHALTLEEAVKKTLADNPQILSAYDTVNQVDAEVDAAWGGYLPQVDLTAASGHERSNNTTTRARGSADSNASLWRNESRLVLSQMVFDGGRVSSSVGQQRARLSSAQATLDDTRETITLRAISAYFDVVRLGHITALATNNREHHRVYLDKITQQEQGGQVSRADIRQAAGRLALAESTLIDFQRQLNDAKSTFTAVIGEMPEELAPPTFLPQSDLPETLSDAIQDALANNPSVQASRHDVEVAAEAVREAKSSFMPRVDAELSGGRAHNLDGSRGDSNEAVALLRMSYNLYAGGSDAARKKARLMRRDAARAELATRERRIRELVSQSWNTYTNTRERLEPLTNHVEAATQTRDAYKDQFDLGTRTLLDLLDSEIELFNAQVTLTNADFDYAFAKYELASLMGKLVQKFTQ